ncbi:IDEAL domain-containing protein [Bacillaceae bacterium S4-13-58]
MKKQKVVYMLRRFSEVRYKKVIAKREISFEIKLAAKLFLDELTFKRNKHYLEGLINEAIEANDRERFYELSTVYASYTKE